jgi:hypothetical protein
MHVNRLLFAASALAGMALAGLALAQDPTPTAFPASDLDLMTVVKSLLGSVNAPALFMLSLLAGGGHRVIDYLGFKKAAVVFLWVVPPLIGMFLGGVSAFAKAPASSGDWISRARLTQSMLEGSIINGGMAIVLGGFASLGAAKIGIFRAPPGTDAS